MDVPEPMTVLHDVLITALFSFSVGFWSPSLDCKGGNVNLGQMVDLSAHCKLTQLINCFYMKTSGSPRTNWP